jgi:hypothetical protein
LNLRHWQLTTKKSVSIETDKTYFVDIPLPCPDFLGMMMTPTETKSWFLSPVETFETCQDFWNFYPFFILVWFLRQKKQSEIAHLDENHFVKKHHQKDYDHFNKIICCSDLSSIFKIHNINFILITMGNFFYR